MSPEHNITSSHAEAHLRAHATRLEVLTEASRAFAEAELDYQALLDLITHRVVTNLGDFCIIRLHPEDAQASPTVAMHHHCPADPQVLEIVRELAVSPLARTDPPDIHQQVFATGQPLLIPVVELPELFGRIQPAYRPVIARLQPRSMLVVALRVRGRTIGILALYRIQAHWVAFTEDDVRLSQDLADRAALAIENARLFRRVQHELAERVRAEQALTAERALLARRIAERTADLSLANAELARAVQLKDEFLATMSHELRTPLNAILLRSQLLQEAIYGPVPPEQQAALRGIAESGQHLLALINDILDLSKIESGRLELEQRTLEVDVLCAMCMRMVAGDAVVKQIQLSSALDGRARVLQADERRLKQILINLLTNAVKFTPAGGAVGLEVRGDVEQGRLTFTVWDTGIGIAAVDLPKLFQPFVQLDSRLSRQYTGTGLGLALVLRLAKAHGGSVAVESTPGQGSRFSVTLPWVPAPLPGPHPAEPPVPTAWLGAGPLLVVEDSPTVVAQLTRYLRAAGAQVEAQPCGANAVERAAALRPRVIFLDLLLPDADGWTVLRQLKADPRTQAIPVVIISVVDAPAQARERGAAALLPKPISRAALEQTLWRLLAAPGETMPAMATPFASAPAARPRVLLAEDHEANITTIADYLQAKGYEVLVARNGHEALARAQEEWPAVILMDIQMPGMDGLEAIRRIRAEVDLADVPIIALTALAMPGDRERCLAAGATDYLAKPVSLRALLTTVETQLRPRTPGRSDR